MIGYVEITQATNPDLRDKTNREGLIEEGRAFGDLRELTIAATDFLGMVRYLAEQHDKRSIEDIQDAKEQVDEGTNEFGIAYPKAMKALLSAKEFVKENKFNQVKDEIETALIEVEKTAEATQQISVGVKRLLEELKLSQDQIDHLVVLSGIGMTAERLTHEFAHNVRKTEEVIQKGLGILHLDQKHNREIDTNINLAIGQLEALQDMLDQMEPLYYAKRRATESLNVADVIRGMIILYSNTIKDLDLDLQIMEEQPLTVRMNKGHMMQVFDNLFDNAFFWLTQRPTDEQPRIVIRVIGKSKTVIFADNGPGVDEKIRYRLFEPFVSSKPDGRGLGLFIIEDILQNYKGDIRLMDEGKILLGANFKITFRGD